MLMLVESWADFIDLSFEQALPPAEHGEWRSHHTLITIYYIWKVKIGFRREKSLMKYDESIL